MTPWKDFMYFLSLFSMFSSGFTRFPTIRQSRFLISENKCSIYDRTPQGSRSGAGHGSIYTEGICFLADWKMLSYQRTGWSCSRGVISPHNSEGASKLLINQNLRSQEKTLPIPPPPSFHVSVPSRALEGRNVLIIARGWPLFTPPILSTTVHSRDSLLVLRAKPKNLREAYIDTIVP